MRRKVRFATEDGTMLRGYLHSAGTEPRPGIVMCHGFGGVKPHIDHYAALFAEAGFAVLLYDHRGFGTSEGTPRQEVGPYRQLDDWRDAITFAESQPEFDAEHGFGAWGTSFAGGLAMITAANDPRIRCVVAQIPNVSGHRNAQMLYGGEQLREIRRRASLDRAARLAGAPPMMVPMFSDDTNEVTVRSLEHLIEFEPAGWLPYVSPKPLLMIIAEDDRCTFTEVQRDVYQDAPGPKKLVSFPGGHFDAYTTFFTQTRPPARDWFVEHLGVHAGSAIAVSR
jgi:dienelactone hydrolase